jgi:hypothetical protein
MNFWMMKLHLSCKNYEKCELKKMSYDVKNKNKNGLPLNEKFKS